VLEWSSIHSKTGPDAVDPFRASLKALTAMLTRHSKGLGFAAPTVAADLPNNTRGKRYVIVRRAAAN
jgi:hypothetical protein